MVAATWITLEPHHAHAADLVPVSITLLDLNPVYDGQPHLVTVETNPAGVAVDITYNGSPTPPVHAGDYDTLVRVTEPGFQGEVLDVLTIDPLPIFPHLDGLAQTADGLPKPVKVVSTPEGITFVVLYDGLLEAPTLPGTYSVSARSADPDYAGSTSGWLDITSGSHSLNLDLGQLARVYDGTPQTVGVGPLPAGVQATVTYEGRAEAPINTGTYRVDAVVDCTVNGIHYTGTALGQLVIGPQPVEITLGDLNHVYDGLGHSVSVTTNPTTLTVVVTYDGSSSLPVAAGGHAVVATVDDPNYSGTSSAQMVIGTAAGTATITLGSLNATYDGTPHAVTTTPAPTGLTVSVTYDGSTTAPTDAGTYDVVATIDQVVSGTRYTGAATAQLVIDQATATITLSHLTAAYDGLGHTVVASSAPSGLIITITYDGSTTAPVHAGDHTVTATIDDPNYTGSTTDTLSIARAAATVSLSNLLTTYTSSPQQPSATTTPSGLSVSLTFDGSPTVPSNAGSYTVVATITDPDHQGTATATFTISKAVAALTISGTAATYDGTTHAVTITSTPGDVTVTVTYDGSATAPTNAGVYDIVATVDDPNREGSATSTLVIARATATTTVTGLDPVYDGLQHPVQVSTVPSGLAHTVTYNGSSTAPFNAGTYAVVVTITDPNYRGGATLQYTMHNPPVAPVLLGGTAPETAPGDGTVIDGDGNVSPVSITVTNTNSGSDITVDDGVVTLTVDPVTPGAITPNPDGSQTLTAGKMVAVTGTGFEPFSLVQIWLFSDPRLLATVRVRADGTFVSDVLVPVDLALGEHTMQVHGFDHHRTRRSLQVGLHIAGRAVAPLPETGSPTTDLTALALAIVAIGLVLQRVSRRRDRRMVGA